MYVIRNGLHVLYLIIFLHLINCKIHGGFNLRLLRMFIYSFYYQFYLIKHHRHANSAFKIKIHDMTQDSLFKHVLIFLIKPRIRLFGIYSGEFFLTQDRSEKLNELSMCRKLHQKGALQRNQVLHVIPHVYITTFKNRINNTPYKSEVNVI